MAISAHMYEVWLFVTITLVLALIISSFDLGTFHTMTFRQLCTSSLSKIGFQLSFSSSFGQKTKLTTGPHEQLGGFCGSLKAKYVPRELVWSSSLKMMTFGDAADFVLVLRCKNLMGLRLILNVSCVLKGLADHMKLPFWGNKSSPSI